MFYIPIIGALIESSGMIIEKKIIKKKNMNYKNYTAYGFLVIVAVMLPVIFFFWKLDPQALELKNILILAAIIIFALLANLLIFYSLKRENLTEFEPIRLMQPLFTILLAFILSFFVSIYSNEKNHIILALALIASITLIITHIKKKHLVFDKYMTAALIGSLFFAIELVLSKMILPYYSSLSFYFIRCMIILIIAWIIFRPNLGKIDKQTHYFTWIVSVLWVVYRAILYWGYESMGIVYTTVLLILTPVFIIIFARIFLREKMTKKQLISLIIILACVIIATTYKYILPLLSIW